jgi:sugar/nucleoside kinase (ribokinase family)
VDIDYVLGAKHLHMSSYYLQTGMQKGCADLFKKAKERGLTTSLDPDSDPSGKWDESIFEVLKYVDIFLPNENEARHISKCDTSEKALDRLSRTVNTVVIKSGKNGAWVKNNDKIIHVNVFKVNVVDTTGAGDSFNSGFIYQYLKGKDIEDCALWGSACAAISTTETGGITAFPNTLQLKTFFSDRKAEIEHLIVIEK